MKPFFSIIIISILIWSCTTSNKSNISMKPNIEEIQTEKKVTTLLAKMTLREKAGQMLNIGLPTVLTGDYWDEREKAVFDAERFKKYIIDLNVGSIHNTPGYLADNKEWYRIVKTIQDSAIKKSRLGIPVLYGIDNIHGANYVAGSVMFPHQIAMAATWNPELTEMSAKITSYESKSASLPWNFNPNADIAMSPLWGRISESFGEDPYLVSEMTNAYVRGSQQNELGNKENSAVCLKHFLGYGAGRNGKDRANAIIPENNLREYFLPPFEKAIAEGAKGVMISSNAVNGIPCHSNKYYITDILKGELGFKGVVISDFSDIQFLIEAHQTAKDMREATKLAVNAGLDLLMNPYDAKVVDIIVDLVENNEIPMSRIDDAVTRVLRLKFELNLFETPYNNPSDFKDFGSEKHIAKNYKSASEAITLLKNENEILPLKKSKKVLVTGYSANSINVLNGAWSRTFLGQDTQYNDTTKLTILDAIKKEVGASNVQYVEGTNYLEDINTSLVVSKAKNVDYIVVCVGELPATEKPSDINELDLPKAQQNLVKKLAALNKPIILVMVQGRPRIIREIEPLVDGIIMGYYPGQEGGSAISDVLFGNINPSGKLPYTYPKFSGNYLTYYHKKTDIRDVNWGYNGFYPQFEFGYGLSYSKFEVSNLKINKDTISLSEELNISIDVKNTSSIKGKEVIQLYLSDLVASVSPDSKKLVRFSKIELNPSEVKTVTFKLNKKDLMFIGADNKWIVEDGEFEMLVGGNPSKMLSEKFLYKKYVN
ncbi:MAG: beta-glucosidase [Lutibacter sp.]|uniref:glycoside hydrolase family 3 N-terminal domain-containing protein n=1 Tax=Lutibacter sp. TaxID=1925666 RepID=UPI0019E8D297|nr:glycoside hydrolase family 3 N-terminal domain-containing protein [Lutibacter sp.]NOR29441.1 beta-glucosidase [Lutibacter sp.]